MKKIGIVVTHPIQYFNEIFSELSKLHEVTVYFSHQQTPDDELKTAFGNSFGWSGKILEGYDFKFLKNRAKKKNVGTFWGCNNPQIFKEVSSNNFDIFIVCGWHSLSYLQAIVACKLSRIPVYIRTDSTIEEPRSSLVKFIKRIFYPLLLKIPTGFLYVGVRSRFFLRSYGVTSDKLHFSPHCVGSENFYLDTQKKLRDIEVVWKILIVSALIDIKRIRDVISACGQLNNQGQTVQLDIVGSGENENELFRLAELESYKINFHSFKNQDELRIFYTASDVLILASESESWGLVVNEAMQCGTPAIVSDAVGCGPDLITQKTGRVFEMGNVDDLANKIIDLMGDTEVTPDSIINHISKFSVHSAISIIEKL